MNLHYTLFSLGNIIPLNIYVDSKELEKDISRYKERFKPYNPRKKGYNRLALSLTSHDGGFSGSPDLDSLFEYNQIHNTHYNESDFREPTPFFKSSQTLQTALKPFEGSIGRSHILKLDKGGFFPPHRDGDNGSFRLFFSITSANHYVFILDEQKISLKLEQFYCLNTNLSHSLFSFKDNSLFAVFNIDLNESSIQSIYKNLESF
ncbi:MAG: hypothetical protein OXJ52_05100 [Oligoflexia bacterium]|nr:hypothetical protein [Oligoflexia bacterium]